MNYSLEQYLTEKFHDKKYPTLSLIGIFWCDKQYYLTLLRRKAIDVRAAYFIAKYSATLQQQNRKKKSPVFDRGVFKKLIYTFENNNSLDLITWDDIDIKNNKIRTKHIGRKHAHAKSSSVQKPVIEAEKYDSDKTRIAEITRIGKERFESKVVFCPYDAAPLSLEKISVIEFEKYKFAPFPQYSCISCSRHFTIFGLKEDFTEIPFEDQVYTNLSIEAPNRFVRPTIVFDPYKRYTTSPSNPNKRPCRVLHNEAVFKCIWENCGNTLLKAQIKTDRAPERDRSIKFCPACGTFYIPESVYNSHRKSFFVTSVKPPVTVTLPNNPHYPASSPEKPHVRNNRTITFKDFIIRKSSVSCIHRNHAIEHIDATVNVIDYGGNISLQTLSAYYCSECNLYYVMDSTYENLRKSGIPLCKVTDEEGYRNLNIVSNGTIPLSPKSILNLLGYNVSQEENLSTEQRHRILREIIDNKICSKDHVISLLNFFIKMRQKQNTSKYDLAISKWESDRDYIDQYNVGNNRKVRVGSFIKR